MLSRIIKYCLEHRLLVILVICLAIFFGVTAIFKASTEFLPDLSSPIISVITENPGLAAQEVETLITRPIESALRSTPNVTGIRSNTMYGVSWVILSFKWGTDYYFARQLITQNLTDVIPRLPLGTHAPILSNAASRLGEVIEYYLKGDLSPLDLRELANYDVRYRMLSVPGVWRVWNMGGEVRQYQVLLDMLKMRFLGVSINQVTNALQDNNENFTGNILPNDPIEYATRGLGRITKLNDLYHVAIATKKGVPLYLKNIATIREGGQFRRGLALIDNKEVVTSTVTKHYGVDTMPVIYGVKRALREIQSMLPSGVEIKAFFDQSELINLSIRNLKESMIIGGIAVILICLPFLNNVRATLILTVIIPVSVVITFACMKLFHITINVMSLGGIVVGLGTMIDGAIVDTENIYRHMLLNPNDRFAATLKGSIEVRRPIAFSTSIIIAVFAPLLFLTGFEGRLFYPFAFTIVVSMLIGFILSLTLTPILCYTFIKIKHDYEQQDGWLTRHSLKGYVPICNTALKRPKSTCLIALGVLGITTLLVPLIGTSLLPTFDEGALVAVVMTPPGASLKETARISDKVAQIIKQAPDVKDVIQRVGRPEGSEMPETANIGEMYIQLADWKERRHSIDDIKDWMRKSIEDFPGTIITFTTPLNDRIEESISGVRGQLAVNIFGNDLDILVQKGNQLGGIMQHIQGVMDVGVEQTLGILQLNMLIDRERANRYGLSAKMIGDAVETAMGGRVVTTVVRDIKEYDVLVRLQERFRDDPEKIGTLLIDTPNGNKVRLSSVCKIWKDTGPLSIKRENMQRRIQVTCNISHRNIGSIVSDIQGRIKDLGLPAGYYVTFGGNYERQQELTRQLITIFIVSAIVVFMLLLAAFRSAWQAFLLIFFIPFALMGGVWALFLTGNTFNISSLIGMVAHFGLTVEKGVIMLEFINELRQEGHPIQEALFLAGKTRMRPVLMTAITSIVGVVPLAIGMGAGSEIQQPMAIVLIGGLITSTSIILIVLPAAYELVQKFIEGRSIKPNEKSF